MSSIRLRLLTWLIGPILLLNLAGGTLTYLLAWVPAQSAFDQGLLDAAGALGARLSPVAQGGVRIDLPRQAEQVLRADQVDAIYFAVRSLDGRLIAGDADFPLLRQPGKGALMYDGQMRGEAARIVSQHMLVGATEVEIGIAKTLRKRLQIRSAIIRALIPLEALITLVSAGLIWFSVSRGLHPLHRMRADLNARGGADLAPLDPDHVPDELAPVLLAFNGLLERVRDGARAQHDFLANVAHQLRTPLAGLRTQLEWLEKRHEQDPETSQSVRMMLLSAARMIRQTNQLLALARAEPSHFEKTRLEPLRLNLLVEEAIQYFVEEAAKKSIDLGFDLLKTTVTGDPFLLRDLIDNLIDNAVRYTPPGGVVTVRCFPHGPAGMLVIEDSGPGIAPAKRDLVFHRFMRLDDKSVGSGLGLAIVRDIALAHGASIAIESNPAGRGMVFSVRF
ncbi:sensor histidine kinase [Janthinobacterium agaricidamnosum]|uniref:histidine kinase n=1 Tax=Janthinobacterium agaricidamnosum NBRC 102515 = DSM 9628 TaxID=1349767 RepID=W0V3T0_9BURK|nr:sensor histidine kinase [Janthinobacterium agaricidamnosum]CDG83474.1 HAMP domain protein [Janthinobacterium agaricidamnosum NBRC 102515 = DSM 9628]